MIRTKGTTTTPDGPTLLEVPVHQIIANARNPRRDVGDITDLAASITAQGILEPLAVAPGPSPVEYTLIAGHRRLAAAKDAGMATVPCVMHPHLDTPAKQLEAMLVENTQRTDLTPAEEAVALQQLLAFPGYTVTKVAKAVGRSKATVTARVAIAALPDKMLERVHARQITLADAEALAAWVGQPEYDDIARTVGTSNFPWAVARAKTARDEHKAYLTVLAHARKAGWTIVEHDTAWKVRGAGPGVLLSSGGTHGVLTRLLADITGDDLQLLTHPASSHWAIARPTEPDPTGDDVDEDDAELEEQAAIAAAARARREDLQAAERARWDYLLEHLINPKSGGAQTALAYVVANLIDEQGAPDDDHAHALGITPQGEDEPEDTYTDRALAAAAAASSWHLTAYLVADWAAPSAYGSRGWDLRTSAHARCTLQLAIAYGYEPSDVETAALAEVQ